MPIPREPYKLPCTCLVFFPNDSVSYYQLCEFLLVRKARASLAVDYAKDVQDTIYIIKIWKDMEDINSFDSSLSDILFNWRITEEITYTIHRSINYDNCRSHGGVLEYWVTFGTDNPRTFSRFFIPFMCVKKV